MKINDKWRIEGGYGDFVLIETRQGRNPKTKEPTTTEDKTYHPTLGSCARKIGRSQTLEALDEDDMWAMVSKVEAQTNRIVEALEKEAGDA